MRCTVSKVLKYPFMSLLIKHKWSILPPPPLSSQPACVLFTWKGPSRSPQKQRKQQKEGYLETLSHQFLSLHHAFRRDISVLVLHCSCFSACVALLVFQCSCCTTVVALHMFQGSCNTASVSLLVFHCSCFRGRFALLVFQCSYCTVRGSVIVLHYLHRAESFFRRIQSLCSAETQALWHPMDHCHVYKNSLLVSFLIPVVP